MPMTVICAGSFSMVICPGSIAASKPDLINQPARRWQSAERGRQAMPVEDDDRPRKKVSHEIGQDLSLLSVEELNERIALLSSEVERIKEVVAKKRASRDAANSVFKS
jgi:uncharacterized small protein (DUF1192 family)